MLAASNGHLETTAQLLVLGADTALQDSDGNTAEQWAKEVGHHDTTSLLKTWTQYKDIDKMMFHNAEDGNEKLVRALITVRGDIHYTKIEGWYGYGDTGYHMAAGNGHLGVVRAYLQHGMEVDCSCLLYTSPSPRDRG